MSKHKRKSPEHGKDLLQISLKRGSLITYKSSSYTDYMVNGNLFVVLNGDQWIGIYNMDSIEYVAYIKEDKDSNDWI